MTLELPEDNTYVSKHVSNINNVKINKYIYSAFLVEIKTKPILLTQR